MSEHYHNNHEEESAFPADEESLLLELARRAWRNGLTVPESTTLEEITVLEERYAIEEIRTRLGDAYPDLRPSQQAAVLLAFHDYYDQLPRTHPRYQHDHSHEHSAGHDCGKIHGPIRRRLETIEQKTTNAIRQETAHALAVAAFRGTSLLFCPGDDLAAIGLQVYGAVSGQADAHTHHHMEHKAVLPRPARIAFEMTGRHKKRVSAELPLDIPWRHSDLPVDEIGQTLRNHIEDIEPEQKAAAARRETKKRRRRLSSRFRRLAFGATLLSLLGLIGSEAVDHSKRPHLTATAPVSPEVQTPESFRNIGTIDSVRIRPGDS